MTCKQPQFIINERGKTRVISGNTIRDRTVRHVMCDDILMPSIQNYLIYDNAASQKDKGVDFARRRLRCHLQKYYRKHGNNGYILLIDFSKYYDNVLHSIAFDQLVKHTTDHKEVMVLIDIVDSFKVELASVPSNLKAYKYDSAKFYEKHPSSGKYLRKSVPIGDQTSQVIGIYYPYRLDNYCKIVKGLKFYGRYMDDIYVIHESKEHLKEVLDEIRIEASALGIFLNENKTQICRLDKPFHFLQNSYCLTDTGRIIERINKKRIVRMRRKLKKLAPRVASGELSKEDIANMYKSWIGAYHKYMSKKQIQNLNELFNSLYGRAI